jgi:effector-binding domain-containing protein
VTVERQLTAVARAQVRFSEIPAAERSLRKMIDDAVGSVDVAPVGHGFTLWRPMGDGRLDLEPGIVVSRVFEPIGEVVPSALPAGRTVHFLLVGSYEGLPGAWQTLFAWSAKEGHKLADINWQIYGDWNDDPARLETSLHALLA